MLKNFSIHENLLNKRSSQIRLHLFTITNTMTTLMANASRLAFETARKWNENFLNNFISYDVCDFLLTM